MIMTSVSFSPIASRFVYNMHSRVIKKSILAGRCQNQNDTEKKKKCGQRYFVDVYILLFTTTFFFH